MVARGPGPAVLSSCGGPVITQRRERASVVGHATFSGQVAFITGAGAGIGRAVAVALAREGADVALFTRTRSRGEDVAAEIGAIGRQAMLFAGDVADRAALIDAVTEVSAHLGPPQLVVASAGIELRGNVLETAPEDWDRVLDVNLGGVFRTCRAVLQGMIDAGGGSIVIIGSDASVMGARAFSAYAASKHALVGLTKCLALDFGAQGVRTNIVCPSYVETDMMFRVLQKGSPEYEEQLQRILLHRFGDPDDIANVVLHLLSPAAAFTNGCVYVLDGGATSTARRGD
jgi:meso-butanediol dehydrogenase/(S,S)-butanediol dehydrogenase/diacetyl reductase